MIFSISDGILCLELTLASEAGLRFFRPTYCFCLPHQFTKFAKFE
jgi:hypothetical protein